MRTTDGPALAATSMIAEDSSSVTGCLIVAEFAFWLLVAAIGARSKAPLAVRATTVPPEARMAAASAAMTTVPVPAPRRGAATAGGLAAGAVVSNQCSGVGSRRGQLCVQSVRGSGEGEKEAAPAGGADDAGVTGVTGWE